MSITTHCDICDTLADRRYTVTSRYPNGGGLEENSAGPTAATLRALADAVKQRTIPLNEVWEIKRIY